jgi:hypothetical protein
MIPKFLLLSSLCLATLLFPQALKSQTQLAMESLVMNPYTDTAGFTLMLQSKDFDWKAADNGKSKADLTLITASVDKNGDVLTGRQESLTITADTEDAVKLATANTRLSAKVKIPIKTNKVRFLIQSANGREIGAFEVDRKTIYAAPQYPPLRFGHSTGGSRATSSRPSQAHNTSTCA